MTFDEQLKRLFYGTSYPTPPPTLGERVFLASLQEIQRERRIKSAIWGTVSAVTAVLFVPALISLYAGVVESGFATYASLVFIDAGTALVYWKDILAVLSESVPTFALASVVTLTFMELFALKRWVIAMTDKLGQSSLIITHKTA